MTSTLWQTKFRGNLKKRETEIRFSDQWGTGLRYLNEFVTREGHSLVSRNHITTDGYRLGGWVSRQRSIRNDLPDDLKQQLEALPKWRW
jgi:hypothetical protein